MKPAAVIEGDMRRTMPELADVLRKTLQDVQDSLQSDTPAMLELKRSLLRTIAALQLEKNEKHILPER